MMSTSIFEKKKNLADSDWYWLTFKPNDGSQSLLSIEEIDNQLQRKALYLMTKALSD